MNVDYNTETQEITVELNTPAIELDTPTGGRGLKGDTGSTGPQGPQGPQGIQGIQGEKGDTGEDGYTPIKGVDYFTAEDIASLNIPTKTSDLNNDSGFITSSSLPTKVSDLTNDTGFITNTVNNLTNYYTSSTTYTKSEVDSLIATVSSLDIEVVQTLPTHDISTSTIYLVPNSSQGTNNYYDEYIYVSNAWELIGSTQVDLTNYYTKTETDTLLSAKADTTDIIPTSNNADYSVGYWNFSSTYISDINTYNTNLMAGEDSVYINSDTQNLPNDLYPLLTSNEIAIIKTYSHKKVYQGKVIAREEIYLPTITNRSWYRNVTRDTSNVKTFGNWYEMANKSDLSSKQDTLVSGTNIKTINNTSLLGSGNIDIQGITTVTGGSIRIWTASPGIYYVPKGTLIYYNGETSNSSDKNDDRDTFLIINEKTNGIVIYYWINGITYERWTYQNSSGALRNMLNAGDLINNLTEQYAGNPLDAKQGKVLKDLIDAIKDGTTIDSFSDVETVLSNKQDTLVSGTNIKTINNQSLLGDGNIDVSGGGSNPTDVRINGTSITSNDVADIQTEGTYNSSTNKIATMSDIPTVPTVGNAKTYYGTSTTGATTAAKTVTCSGFTLETGATIFVKFTNANTYNGTATLNVNSTGAKDIARVGTTKTTRYYWSAGELVGFTYDGTNWLMIERGTATTTYYGLTKLSSSTSSTSTELAATPSAVKAAYDLANGKQNAITSTNKLDYSLIDNTPTIPTKVSDLSNDTGFITNTVNNLTNYYNTSNTYTKSEVDTLIGAISTLNIQVVQSLPSTGSTTTIYLVPKTASTNDAYDEYIYVNNSWEHIGSTEVDLSNYYNKSQVDTLLNGKANTSAIPTKVSDLQNDSGYISSYTETDPTVPSHVKSITQANITSWNNKSDFSGSYNDLSDKPSIPDSTSDLTNDSGFITNAVSNLTNYTTTTALQTLLNGKMDYTELTGNSIRIWSLEEGFYINSSYATVYYYGSSDTTNKFTVDAGSIIMISDATNRSSNHKTFLVVTSMGSSCYMGYSTSSAGELYDLLKSSDIKNNLTTSTAGKVLDASQGKALKDTLDATTSTSINNMNNIGTLANLTTTAKTDLVSAINEVNDGTILDLDDIMAITSSSDNTYVQLKNLIFYQRPFYVANYPNSGYEEVFKVISSNYYDDGVAIEMNFVYIKYNLTYFVNIIESSSSVIVYRSSQSLYDSKINGNVVSDIITNTAYNSTTNKLATMADIPAAVSPNIMTVYLAADFTIANTNTYYDMLNTAVLSSSGSKLTFSNGKIVIGSGVSKVKVSYTAKSVSQANATRSYTYLMQDISGTATAVSQEGHWYGGTGWQVENTYGPIILDVNQGDAFYLRCYGYKNNYIAGAASTFKPTLLTVEVIE